MKPCGLLGERLSHSFSPLIHSRLGNYEYRLFPTPKEELDDFLKGDTFGNLNVTMPYKKDVIPYCKELSPLATRIGSVNTIKRKADGLYGYNTDYYGFCYMLQVGKIHVKDQTCAVIGAGGAAKTVCVALQDLGAKNVTVVSHAMNTPAFIQSIADHTIVVNTSPVGMYPNNGCSPVDLKQFHQLRGVADLIFNPLKTALLLQAEALGVPCVGGLPMLVAQAKRAAEIFEDRVLDDGIIPEIQKEITTLCETVCLVGMPGSGKSTLGKMLAQALGKPFLDTDAMVEEKAGKKISAIFAEDGEDVFRYLETQALAEATRTSGAVVATGGGIVKRLENYPYLKQNGRVILLLRDIETLPSRGRPLSSSPQAIQALYWERKPLYEQVADVTICNDGTPEESLRKILQKLI